MTVVQLRPALKINRAPMPQTRVLSLEARQAYSSLKGRMGQLDRIFSGRFALESQAAEIGAICEEIRIDAQRVWRLSR
jgi:hypothetical protein